MGPKGGSYFCIIPSVETACFLQTLLFTKHICRFDSTCLRTSKPCEHPCLWYGDLWLTLSNLSMSITQTIWFARSKLSHLVWCLRYDYVQKTNEGCFVQLATLDTEKPILFLGHLERTGHLLRWWVCIDDKMHSGTLNVSMESGTCVNDDGSIQKSFQEPSCSCWMETGCPPIFRSFFFLSLSGDSGLSCCLTVATKTDLKGPGCERIWKLSQFCGCFFVARTILCRLCTKVSTSLRCFCMIVPRLQWHL